MKFYKVQVTLGHLGCGYGLEAWLYVKAKNMYSAIKKAQKFPGVKHGRLPKQALEISKEEYVTGLEEENYKNWMNKIAKMELVKDNQPDLNSL